MTLLGVHAAGRRRSWHVRLPRGEICIAVGLWNLTPCFPNRINEQLALTKRYAQITSQPIDLSDEGAAEARSGLMLAVNDLMRTLQRDFLQ
jgi:hypothetical protein